MKIDNPVAWFEIYVDDMPRAQKFYEQMLGVQLNELPTPTEGDMQMMAFPMDEEAKNKVSGALVKMKGFKAGGSGTLVYFHSDDCAVEEARIEAAGGTVINGKTSIGDYGFMVLAQDTEGNMFGLHSAQ